jgi:hypothetical protein
LVEEPTVACTPKLLHGLERHWLTVAAGTYSRTTTKDVNESYFQKLVIERPEDVPAAVNMRMTVRLTALFQTLEAR